MRSTLGIGARPAATDGQLILHFTVTRGDKTLACGVDTITLRDGKISQVVGVY